MAAGEFCTQGAMARAVVRPVNGKSGAAGKTHYRGSPGERGRSGAASRSRPQQTSLVQWGRSRAMMAGELHPREPQRAGTQVQALLSGAQWQWGQSGANCRDGERPGRPVARDLPISSKYLHLRQVRSRGCQIREVQPLSPFPQEMVLQIMSPKY